MMNLIRRHLGPIAAVLLTALVAIGVSLPNGHQVKADVYSNPTVSMIGQTRLPIVWMPTTNYGGAGANGAFTSGTSILATNWGTNVTDALCVVPANSISSSIPAAQTIYFCKWTSATQGTIYNNIYTPGTTPLDIASPTAFVTTGNGSVSNPLAADVTFWQTSLGANTIGPNEGVACVASISATNNADSKIVKLKLGSNNLQFFNPASAVGYRIQAGFSNSGVTNSQVTDPPQGSVGFGSYASSQPVYFNVDMTQAQTLAATFQVSTSATDYFIVHMLECQKHGYSGS